MASRAAAAPAAKLVPGTLEHFCEWASRLTLPAHGARGLSRRPKLVIESFQRRALGDYFRGVAETFILLPKGNGKSVLMAALALYHLVHTEEAEAYVFAASRDQAKRLLNAAAGFVRRSPGLRKRLDLKLGYLEIRSRVDGGVLKVLAADPDTADGIAPTLVLCDELHRWKSLEVYTLAKEGLDKRPGQLIGISTAGADEASSFGVMRRAALEHLVEHDGAYKRAVAPSGEFVWHEWSLSPEDDIEDMELVKTANPLSTITVDSLRKRWESPGTRRAWWARFVCNIWTQDDDAAISAMDWAPCQADGCEIPDQVEHVVIGIDLGWRRDTTAMVPTWKMADDPCVIRVDRRLVIIPAPGDGTMTPEEDLQAAIREMAGRWPHATVVIDPSAGGESFAQWIERELGLTVVIQPQDPSPMAHATGLTLDLVLGRRLEHPGHLEFSSQVLGAHLKAVGGGERVRFCKAPNGRPNDALIALAMAVRQHHVAADEPTPIVPFLL